MRLIDAKALKKAIEKAFDKANLSEYEACVCVCEIYDKEIDNAPTVEPERPQGEWIDYDNTFYKCPECGYLLEKCCPQCQTKIILPFCHCGADTQKGGAE